MTAPSKVHDAIVAANETFMSTFSRGDAAGIAALYTTSGQFLPPNSDFVMGRKALQGMFQGLMDMGIKKVKLETVEVEGYGDTASEVGRYTLAGDGGQVLDQSKYVIIWKRVAGQRKLHRDIFNSSLPVPACGDQGRADAAPTRERLAAAVAGIKLIDWHSHVLAMPYEQMPGNAIGEMPWDFPGMLQVTELHWIDAWKALYDYEGDSVAPEFAKAAYLKKQELRKELGEGYLSWVLDQLGVPAALVDLPMSYPGQAPPRFFRMAHMDGFLYPFGIPPKIEQNEFLSAVVVKSGASASESLEIYTTQTVLPHMEAAKAEGVVAIKFTTAYLRPLSLDKIDFDETGEIYKRGSNCSPLPPDDGRKLEDFLFRFITREAGRLGLVAQIPTGVGADPRWNFTGSNPLLLESVVDDPEQEKTNFVLIHDGWPFSEQAGAMLMKPNVFGDLSAQTWLRSNRKFSETLRSWLEWYLEKVMYGSDAMPTGAPLSDCEEKMWLASTSFWKALVEVLTEMMDDGQISYARAVELAEMSLRTNTIKLYGLDSRLT